ncbi:hypothetical protein MMC08_008233, partial [Hypocenomyce scalaris]|nr:hypothetical protein [Hypocenomyce scalaris]
MASSTRDPITCHVLDQTTGLPAPAVAVTLTVGSSTSKALTYTALTSTTDGRINTWTRAPESPTLFEALGVHDWMTQEAGRKVVCSLKFNTLQYFGEGKTFFPE